MTHIDLYVTGASAVAEVHGLLTHGMVGVTVTVHLDDEWAGFAPKMYASCKGVERQMVIDGAFGSSVPVECLIGGETLSLAIDGWDADGVNRIPTIYASCGFVKKSPANSNASAPDPAPTPGIVDQILSNSFNASLTAENAVSKANQAVSTANEAKEAAITAQDSAAASAAEAKKSEEESGKNAAKTAADLENLIEIDPTGILVPTLDAHEKLVNRVEELEENSGTGAVESVNGKTGAVQLTAADVGALPSDTVIPEAYDDTEIKQQQLALKEDLNKKVGYSEVVNGQLLMYSDSTKEHLLATLDLPTADLTDYVKNTDYAAADKGGAVKIESWLGHQIASSGALRGVTYNAATYQNRANETFISKGTLQNVLAAPSIMPALTAEEQLAGRQRLGLEKNYELIDTITVGASGLWELSSEPDGKPYAFDSAFVFRTYGGTIDPSLATGYGRVQVFYGTNKAFNAECGRATSASKYNITHVTLERGLYICKYIRTGGYGDSAPTWASKLAKGLGWDLENTPIWKIRNNPEDKDPPGTIISIYAIRR